MFGNHGLCGLPEEGAHEKSPKCLGGNLGDFGEFCKGLSLLNHFQTTLNQRTVQHYLFFFLENMVAVILEIFFTFGFDF